MLPGDPARLVAGPEADATVIDLVRKQLGLDQPLYMQFIHYICNVLQGDFGISMVSRRPVSEEIASRFMPTFWLTIASMSWAVVFGLGAGDYRGRLAQPLAGQARHGAGGDRHLLPGVRAGDAADADLLRRAGLAADRRGRYLEALHPAFHDAGGCRFGARIPQCDDPGGDDDGAAVWLSARRLDRRGKGLQLAGAGTPAGRFRRDARLPGDPGGSSAFSLEFILINLVVDVLYAAINPAIRYK
ncbi:hypothetical protein L1887_45174 [Cichorium endivia]|nr:hypothetical protein L1887_45174 [Cichorium endivia]